MSSLVNLPEIIGFFSYSREDDEGSEGALSALRNAIQSELGAQIGRSRADFRIWQDKAAIPHGTLWENEIKLAIAQSAFFIPIVTPRSVGSSHCFVEFSSFLNRETELSRNDLIFPLLYISIPGLDDERQWRNDPVLKVIGERQYFDWRNHRHLPLNSPEARTQIERFCQNIAQALRKQCRAPDTAIQTDAAIETAPPADPLPSPARTNTASVTNTVESGPKAIRWLRQRPWPLATAGILVLLLVNVFAWWLMPRTPPAPLQPLTGRFFTALSSERERLLQPGDAFKECEHCPEMIVLPAGAFTMGSPASAAQHRSDESPQHKVTFAEPFAIGRFAVTFEEWDACVSAGGCNGYSPPDEKWGRDRRPVVNVSWDEANAYANWLSKQTGRTYRLLSEAEREYATRAGTTTEYYFGNDAAKLDSVAWYNANSEGKTHPVGEKSPNAFGLYDLHGNAWDWTLDCYNASYVGAPADGSPWTTGDCNARVLRGGSWYQPSEGLRSARRGRTASTRRVNNFGFRVASPIAAALN
jgi:formylglycine-generating enzyme required for sulfatase activity